MDSISRRNLLKTSAAFAGAVAGAGKTRAGEEYAAGVLHLECKFIEKTIDGVRRRNGSSAFS